MSYKQLTKQERHSIEQLLKLQLSLNQIAKTLERSPSTIAREIKRNRTQTSKRHMFNKRFPDNNCLKATTCTRHHLCELTATYSRFTFFLLHLL